jgi:hypothetical protein
MRYKMIAAPLILGLFVTLQPALAQKTGKEKGSTSKPSQVQAPAVDPRAMEVLTKACEFLKAQKQFTYKAEVENDQVYYGGKKLQYSFDLEAEVQRPDKLRITGEGDVVHKSFVYDGKTITLYDKNHNVYASHPAPPDIEGALDKAQKDLGLTVALSDLASPQLCEHVTRNLLHGLYVGVHKVRGVPCHHLAFDRGEVHVQLWIETGDKPLLRKVVLTHMQVAGSPQWTALLTEWNLSPQFEGTLFSFIPPKGAEMIDFAPPQTSAGQKSRPAGQKKKGGK